MMTGIKTDNLLKYKGEWCRSLYSEDEVAEGKATRGIPLFDIELPRVDGLYDEGIRGTPTNYRAYNPEKVGTGSAQRPFFCCLTKNKTLEDTNYHPASR